MQLTPHFNDTELNVAGAEQRLVDNATFICQALLEPIREQFGPIRVDDGYRDAAENIAAGGKVANPHTGQQDSYHLFESSRSAADIRPLGESTMEQVFDWLRLESHLPFDKVIYETEPDGAPGCLHLQIDSAVVPRREAFTGETGAGTVYTPVAVNP